VEIPDASTPIVCDMTDAPDTDVERMAEYRRLFSEALTGRERTAEGIRFRFRAGTEAWVRDLAAREKACCAFFASAVTTEGKEVIWDVAVTDNDLARAILDEFYALPDTLGESPDGLRDRLADRGVAVASVGAVHHFQRAGAADHTGG
jgi:hypothetical protein